MFLGTLHKYTQQSKNKKSTTMKCPVDFVGILFRSRGEVDLSDFVGGRDDETCVSRKNYRGCVDYFSEGADVKSDRGTTALVLAASRGHVKCAEKLLDEGADVNYMTSSGERPLTFAAERGHADIVELFIGTGADINSTDMNGLTALFKAVKYGQERCVEILLNAGANVNAANKYEETPLMNSIMGGQLKCAELLFKAGADMNKANSLGQPPLLKAVFNASFLDILIKGGADVNISDKHGNTALILASGANELRCVQMLLKAGAHVNRKNMDGHNALTYSVFHGSSPEVVNVLFAAGETVDRKFVVRRGIYSETVPCKDIPTHITEPAQDRTLFGMCRNTIRSHLLHLDPHTNLLGRIPQLGLPSLLNRYLLHDALTEIQDVEDVRSTHFVNRMQDQNKIFTYVEPFLL